MKKVLLVYPGRLYAPIWGYEVWNLKPVLLNLFSYLSQEPRLEIDVLDFEVELGNPAREEEVDKFKNKVNRALKGRCFDIVAISCYLSTNYLSTKMIAEMCRKINGTSTIVVGGHHPSVVPDDFLYKNSPFDFIVLGEGEEALLKICKGDIEKSGRPRIIQGTALNLRKSFPLKLKEFKYSSYKPVYRVGFELSRGCVFNCSYCPKIVVGTCWRAYSLKDSIKKIEEAIDSLNPVEIGFMDPCFGFNKFWRRSLLKEIIRSKIDKVFWASPRIELLEPEDIDLFARLNFRLLISLESGSEKILGIMERTKYPKEYLKKCKAIIDYINRKKIPNDLFVILNHPGENLYTFEESLRYVESLAENRKDISTKVNFTPYYILPGTPAYRKLKYFERKYGTYVKYKEWWKDSSHDQYKLATDVVASGELKDINPYLIFKDEIVRLRHLLMSKLSKERMSFNFVLQKIPGGENENEKLPFNHNMNIPEFLFKR